MIHSRHITRGLLAAVLLFGLAGAPAEARRPTPQGLAALEQGRALWVKRDQLKTRERAAQMVDDAADAGYTVLFLQVRGRGDAWYLSDLEPRAGLLKDQLEPDGTPWDPLAFVLRRAHARGLQVHAWFNSFLVWSAEDDPAEPRHVLNRHPEWVAVDGDGRSLADYSTAEIAAARMEGVFLSPGIPAVRRYLTAVVHELASRYPLDGIHLDYTRWALKDTGYDPATRAAFIAEQNFDPYDLRRNPTALTRRFGAGSLPSLEKTWRTWKAAQVTEYVAGLRADLDALPRPIVLSAAVFPNVEYAPRDVLQDWGRWARDHDVDMLVPMFYSPSTPTVLHQLEMAQEVVPADVVLYAGLAVWNQPLASAAEKAVAVRRAGAQGVCFFPYDTLAETPGALRRLTRAAFGNAPIADSDPPPSRAPGSNGTGVTAPPPETARPAPLRPSRSPSQRAATATRRDDPEDPPVTTPDAPHPRRN